MEVNCTYELLLDYAQCFKFTTVQKKAFSQFSSLFSGRFGLWLDADLYHGRSNSCSTFNNDVLSKKEDFVVQDVEVWTFE